MAQDITLEARGLTRGFKGFTAVSDVNSRVQCGFIHTLIGPDGAGKTVRFNLLTRFLMSTRGAILFNGIDITSEKPVQTVRRGVIRSFQISTVFPHLTVMENAHVGLQRQFGTAYALRRSEWSLNTLNTRAVELFEQVGLAGFAYTMTVELPYGRKHALKIATILAMGPELMLLDRPAQGTGHGDVDRVAELVKRVAQGRMILIIEHNMNVASSIADKITVLQRGQILAESPYENVSRNPQVMEACMGTADAVLGGY